MARHQRPILLHHTNLVSLPGKKLLASSEVNLTPARLKVDRPLRRAMLKIEVQQTPTDYFNLASISFAISRCSRIILAVLSAKLFTFPSFASFSNAARSFS